jgi:mannose-1-phosphate guanylyltransferase
LPAGGMGWNDLGSWSALYEELAPGGGTVTQGGNVVELDAANNFVQAPGKTVALIGVKDLVVVETQDALLIVPRAQAQKVGRLVAELEKQGRDKLL